MSKQSINNYYNKLSQYKRFGGTRNETSVRRAFANLLEEYCLPKNLILVDELHLKNSTKRPDGTVRNSLQLDWGYWESKDLNDNLEAEIEKKIEIGYPTFNILFENSELIVLIQKGAEVMRGEMNNIDFLHRILTAFVEYERPEITDFRIAVEKFREDVPDIVEALRAMIADQEKNPIFTTQREKFWNVCRESINPDISAFDIREMLIQHILTAEIFDTVFDSSHFHRENNIARELETVINTFFFGKLRHDTLSSIDNYYKAIKAEAARIENHHEKQKFLKVIYETFYKAYNPKGADRLGVVYTPNEIVKFMVETTDYLLEKHFGKSLAEKNVQILDPATGTGTFITEIIEHIPEKYLKHKYQNEIHCNELAILPYYIANLNIEFTYQQKMGEYAPFENIVFVDTLDNLGFDFVGKQNKLFAMTAENLERIKKQNEKQISVIIGNPPYNAKQINFNDFNPNKRYKTIDERIKETYIQYGRAQNQIVLYDMFTRFLRWSSDRIDKNGILAYVTNNTFIDAKTYDGFRKVIEKEFNEIYIVNLKGNARTSGERRRKEAGNVFDDQIRVGVAVYFLVKSENARGFKVFYNEVDDYLKSKEKLQYLQDSKIQNIPFETIHPDKNNNWINLTDNDWEDFIQLISKDVKSGKGQECIFKLFSRGIVTQRDEWVYDFSKENLTKKINYFVDVYQKTFENENHEQRNKIKWDRELTNYLKRRVKKEFDSNETINSLYRPFTKQYFYFDKHFNGMTYQWYNMYRLGENINKTILIKSFGSNRPFNVLSTDTVAELHVAGANQCLPIYRYDKSGNRIENITDWGLEQFRKNYELKDGEEQIHNSKFIITKEDIFHYVYAVLHNPAYRKKYEMNLKREFPRIPFYNDFWKWAAWGKTLMDLHINYETVESYELVIRNEELKNKKEDYVPKAKLKADIESGEIVLDEQTTLCCIPALAWEYKLGNRSALHWILDQYKEKTPKDPTIREKFNTYKFADYKETVIDLIQRLTTVSIRTMEIVNLMETEEGHQ